ncbi:hypothetical protein AAV35_014055 (plasmid) [Salimicrobium jeotgali]|uniref:Uncharacterized protein n=1 Tax=Salimicrobium jeotgali TaxID=1230341 RepID=K2H4V2_9BACI|nr:hypothetical protein [Salimicrobium jeotgali]AKN01843.1 hypothetical protein AAV35_014055 [Salimicrobium jeotgali]EKE30905.1 hypothetical protein MJ3_11210 [Salimicrobium jeotgali]MBM7697595.1 hypothetical protein [Salimicrobium jeotgali]
MDKFEPEPLLVKINLGGRESFYLKEDEKCYFYQEDVSWYEYAAQYNAFDCIASGALYVTDRQVLLYDPGFSNIWTKLSKDGDYPKQVLTRKFSSIVNQTWNMSIGRGHLKGPVLECIGRDCWLPPSQRKYKNRKNPIVSKYRRMDNMVEIIIRLKILNERR